MEKLRLLLLNNQNSASGATFPPYWLMIELCATCVSSASCMAQIVPKHGCGCRPVTQWVARGVSERLSQRAAGQTVRFMFLLCLHAYMNVCFHLCVSDLCRHACNDNISREKYTWFPEEDVRHALWLISLIHLHQILHSFSYVTLIPAGFSVHSPLFCFYVYPDFFSLLKGHTVKYCIAHWCLILMFSFFLSQNWAYQAPWACSFLWVPCIQRVFQLQPDWDGAILNHASHLDCR